MSDGAYVDRVIADLQAATADRDQWKARAEASELNAAVLSRQLSEAVQAFEDEKARAEAAEADWKCRVVANAAERHERDARIAELEAALAAEVEKRMKIGEQIAERAVDIVLKAVAAPDAGRSD